MMLRLYTLEQEGGSESEIKEAKRGERNCLVTVLSLLCTVLYSLSQRVAAQLIAHRERERAHIPSFLPSSPLTIPHPTPHPYSSLSTTPSLLPHSLLPCTFTGVLKGALVLFYYWVNFAPITRGTSATGYAILLGVLLTMGEEPAGTKRIIFSLIIITNNICALVLFSEENIKNIYIIFFLFFINS
jgi:hypothetical protein